MLKNGQISQVTISGYTSDGQGVCRIDGCAVFVPNVLAGEVCTVKVVKVGKTVAWGKLEQLIVPSPHRVQRACPYAKLCGGCQFWHMDYEEETSLKAQRVCDALRHIAKAEISAVPILPAATVSGYRNKAQYPVSGGKTPIAGFYKERTHDVVSVERCLILPLEADRAKDAVLSWMRQYKISAYNEKTGKGLVRHIYVRKGFATGQVLVCIVANGGTLPQQDALLRLLQKSVASLTSVVLSVNHKQTNAVLGDRFMTLFGNGYIEDTLCGLTFRLSARSFYQVNRAQAEKLYEMAVAAAQLTKNETVLDLYCGTGTITLAMARHAKHAIGVELIEQAIADAKENAKRNQIENAEFFCADASDAAKRLAQQGTRPDVIVVDPPRKGLAPDVIEAMLQMQPQRIVYVSCDPATLARDIAEMVKNGYSITSIQAVDLFPRCAHVETVCLLVRRNGLHINIDVDVEELLHEKRGQATYPQIKEYVLEQTGMKVSSLYISQVKRKCGLDVSDSYNKPKSEDAHVPQCPPEKEKAIMDTLRHFGLIS